MEEDDPLLIVTIQGQQEIEFSDSLDRAIMKRRPGAGSDKLSIIFPDSA